MAIIIRNSYETLTSGTTADIAVFCDVFRASTTLLAIINACPEKIILTNDEETARRFVAQGALLFSEVFGGGFDNSPTQVRSLELSGKVVIHKSTNLTNAIFNHAGFKRGYIGGFVNLGAVVRFLHGKLDQRIEIVAASHFGRRTEAVEDVSCVRLIADRCRNVGRFDIPELEEIKQKIADKRQKGGYQDHYFSDVEFALKLDAYDFLAEIKILDEQSMELFRIDVED